MIQSISLASIARKWAEAIAADQEIISFCNTHYGRPPKVYLGLNLKRPPTEKDCPFIIVRPGVKREGEDEPEFNYSISVSWAIVNEQCSEVNGVLVHAGIGDVDALGQRLYETLSDLNPSYPISTADMEIETIEFFPQCVGEMELMLTITPAIGGNLTY